MAPWRLVLRFDQKDNLIVKLVEMSGKGQLEICLTTVKKLK